MLERHVPGQRRMIDPTALIRQGEHINGLASDLKRQDYALAVELGIDLETVRAVFRGTADPETVSSLLDAMTQRLPVSRLDLEVAEDDTDDGVIVLHEADALKTLRDLPKKDRTGEDAPFYNYRDSAMSKLNIGIKPERIAVLRHVTDSDPNNPDVVYNHGHFLHQVTFYVGDINFYWEDANGERHMIALTTGDSTYHTPFVPHTFTKRNPNEDAYIMAVTFGARLQGPKQRDLSVVDPARLTEATIDLSSHESAFASLLRQRMNQSLITPSQLACSGIPSHALERLLTAQTLPSEGELAALAQFLGLSVRDLMPPSAVPTDEVVIERSTDRVPWPYPDENPAYAVRRLADSTKVPDARSFALQTLKGAEVGAEPTFDLTTPMHGYGYNWGGTDAILEWQGNEGVIHRAVVEPGASFYTRPLAPVRLRSGSKEPAQIMLFRLGGDLTGDGLYELSSLPSGSYHRIAHEKGSWTHQQPQTS